MNELGIHIYRRVKGPWTRQGARDISFGVINLVQTYTSSALSKNERTSPSVQTLRTGMTITENIQK